MYISVYFGNQSESRNLWKDKPIALNRHSEDLWIVNYNLNFHGYLRASSTKLTGLKHESAVKSKILLGLESSVSHGAKIPGTGLPTKDATKYNLNLFSVFIFCVTLVGV